MKSALSVLLLCFLLVSCGEDEVKALKKRAEHDFTAQCALAYRYAHGEGVPKDYVEAVKWYRRAAEQGNVFAQYNLGSKYYLGKGVPKDFAEAAKWYRKAAEQGQLDAQCALGFMYDSGFGVSEDDAKAYMFFNIAAAKGSEDGEARRDKIEKRMTQEQIAKGQKLTREWLERQ